LGKHGHSNNLPYLGKTTLLYYILVKRLLEQKRTILQNSTQHLFFFNENGIEVLRPFTLVDPKSEKYQNTWALVDINVHVERPAEMLSKETSPFFLVMASSLRASRLRGLQKYGRPSAFWLMKPFNLAELIQASVFLASDSFFVTHMISQSSTSTVYSRGVRY
jgi:hypothetical protein